MAVHSVYSCDNCGSRNQEDIMQWRNPEKVTRAAKFVFKVRFLPTTPIDQLCVPCATLIERELQENFVGK